MNNNYPYSQHPAMENEGLQPYVNTLEAEQELRAYELENSRPAVEAFPTLSKPDPNLSPDLCNLRDKLSSQQATLKSQLKQVEEQLHRVNQQLDKFS